MYTFDFHGQTALVTGGTKGIGRQIAEDLQSLGANLIVTGTRPQFSELKCRYYSVDFTQPDQVDQFVANLKGLERIDVCVNNAGINRIALLEETPPNDLDDILNVNLRAPFLITTAVVSLMKHRRYGRIVNVGSIFGHISRAQRACYTSSKYGLRGLSVTAGIELAPYDILVNTVSPGFVRTELTEKILTKEQRDQLVSQVPILRFAEPSEIAKVVVFLCSRMNSYITGQNIIVDGGYVSI